MTQRYKQLSRMQEVCRVRVGYVGESPSRTLFAPREWSTENCKGRGQLNVRRAAGDALRQSTQCTSKLESGWQSARVYGTVLGA